MNLVAWLLLLAVPPSDPPDPGPWPGWRGPARDGRVEAKSIPSSIAPDALRKRWSVPLGPSYSGPVVSRDAVFTTETQDETREVVSAYDRREGRLIWRVTWPGSIKVPFFAAKNGSWIRSTPAFDGERLYVAGMRDLLVCLDAVTGKILWRVDFTQRFSTPLPSFGFVSSPLVDDAHVYVQAGASFVKLDKVTGETVWRTLHDGGGMYGSAFSSPIRARLDGRDQLLVQTRERLAGVDPADGIVLWDRKITAFRGMNILTPTVYDDSIFTATYGGKALRIRVAASGEELDTSVAWSASLQGYMTSPVIVDGHAYLLLRNQRLACVRLEDGETAWISDRKFGKYWSMVTDGRRILGLDERGMLYLVRPDILGLDILDTRKVSDEETWAHLAPAGDQVFIRSLNRLDAWDWTSERVF